MKDTKKLIKDWHKFLVSYRKNYGYEHFKVKIDFLLWLEMKVIAERNKQLRHIIDTEKGTFSGAKVIPTYTPNPDNFRIVLGIRDLGLKRWLKEKAYTVRLKTKMFFGIVRSKYFNK